MLHLLIHNLKDHLLEILLIYLISRPKDKVLNLKSHKSSLLKEVIRISYSGQLMLSVDLMSKISIVMDLLGLRGLNILPTLLIHHTPGGIQTGTKWTTNMEILEITVKIKSHKKWIKGQIVLTTPTTLKELKPTVSMKDGIFCR